MRIRLTKKLAEALNGVDLRRLKVGDIADLDASVGCMLVAENWAQVVMTDVAATAGDRPVPRRNRPSTREKLDRLLAKQPGTPNSN